jgi:hypothetical protein
MLLEDEVTRYGRERWRLGFIVGLVIGLMAATTLVLALHFAGRC